MSSFQCEQCSTMIIDSDKGYVTGCEHWPIERNIITVIGDLAFTSPIEKLICSDCGETKHPATMHPYCNQDRMTLHEYTEAEKALKEIWASCPPHDPQKIERDILDELSTLRQKVLGMEKAKAFNVEIYKNIIQRLNDAEDKLRIMERILGGLELQRLRGNG